MLTSLRRKDIKAGVVINHLGTTYLIIAIKGEDATVKNIVKDRVLTVPKKIIQARGKLVEEEK